MSVKLYLGKSEDVLKGMANNSVDTVISDPPYGLSFMGKKWDYDVPSVDLWKEVLRVLKPGGTALIFAGSRTQHRMAVNVEDAGFILKDCIMWIYGSGFPKATDISKQLDKGHKREIIGEERCGKNAMMGGLNNIKTNNGKIEITIPATPEAKLWNGWKSHGLKPAYEPIIVAMKPNDGTYANNALVHGVSGLNIDGGRIGTDKIITNGKGKQNGNTPIVPQAPDYKGETHIGRFPANIILDEEAGKMLDEQSGERASGKSNNNAKIGESGDVTPLRRGGLISRNDKGGASRFFYCAKASKSERNPREGKNSNNHPTVKPLKLMEYLCILTATPTGGIVLDPFMGSGTTGVACKLTGRDFIGIEMNEEYMKIAQARIKNVDTMSR